jgi:hypothetical protein
MRKATFLLLSAMFLFLIRIVNVIAAPNCQGYSTVFSDQFERYTIPPWQAFITQPSGVGSCTSPQCVVIDDGHNLYEECSTTQHLCFGITNITSTDDFDWNFDWDNGPADMGTWAIAELSHQGLFTGGFASVRIYTCYGAEPCINRIQFSYNSIISDVQTQPYPWNYICTVDTGFGYYTNWKINRTDDTVHVYGWHATHYDELANCSNPNFNGLISTIALATYAPSVSAANSFDNTTICSIYAPKIQPTLTIDISPTYNVSSGTQTMASCTANYIDVPIILSYFGEATTNPDVKTLSVGHHWYFCDSNETSQYYEAHAARDLWVYQAPAGLPTEGVTYPNASQPVSAINETEWRDAGFAWALIFVSPIGFISIVSLIIGALVGKLAGGAIYGVMAFVFLMFIMILYMQILPTWMMIVFIVIAAIGVVYFTKGLHGGGGGG